MKMDIIPVLPHHQTNGAAASSRTEPDGLPFQHKNVQEWSQLDELTGMLEHGRLELDHWAASGGGASHKYGKVVDSRSRNLPDGSVQQRQKKQFEVFQSQVSGASLQVIRTRTVTSSSSSNSNFSMWQGNSPSSSSSIRNNNNTLMNNEFGNLQLTYKPLDVTPQKAKATVGRSGSISSRRPPSRQRNVNKTAAEEDSPPNTFSSDMLSDLSDRREQLKSLSLQDSDSNKRSDINISKNSELNFSFFDKKEQSNSVKGRQTQNSTKTYVNDILSSHKAVSESFKQSLQQKITASLNSTPSSGLQSLDKDSALDSLGRKKSSSTENLEKLTIADEDSSDFDNGETNPWRRSPRARRSLQFSPEFTVNFRSSSSHNSQETIITNKPFGNFRDNKPQKSRDPLKSTILRDFTNGDDYMVDNSHVLQGAEGENDKIAKPKSLYKKSSIVTAESLNEVRKNLRHLKSPLFQEFSETIKPDDDDCQTFNNDTATLENDSEFSAKKEELCSLQSISRPISQKNPCGTGSLESRTSHKNDSNGCSRLEEWYNRRRSYGFEPIQSPETMKPPSLTTFREKNIVESSTDSGICRSSDNMNSSWEKNPNLKRNSGNFKGYEDGLLKSSKLISENKTKFEDVATLINVGSNNTQNSINKKIDTPVHNFSKKYGSYLENVETVNSGLENTSKLTDKDQTDILENRNRESEENYVVPSNFKSNIVNIKRQLFENLNKNKHSQYYSTGESLTKQSPFSEVVLRRNSNVGGNSSSTESELKRHSIATDEPKYLRASFVNSFSNEDSINSLQFNARNAYLSCTQKHSESKAASPIVSSVQIVSADDSGEKSDNMIEKSDVNDIQDQSINGKRQKKVEFCKTEVHFAAEPGKINIIETDEKPPPTTIFRRRRRNSNPSVTTNRGNLPEIHFGDSPYEISLLGITDNRNQDVGSTHDTKLEQPKSLNCSEQNLSKYTEKEENSCMESNFSIVKSFEDTDKREERSVIRQTGRNRWSVPNNFQSGFSTKRTEDAEIVNSDYLDIDKNDVDDDRIGTGTELWGVKLKPVKKHVDYINEKQPQIHAENIKQDNVHQEEARVKKEYDRESVQPLTENISNQKSLNLTEPHKVSSFHINIGDKFKVPSTCSVAERIRQAESNSTRSKCFSTKVNFKGGEAFVVQPSKQDNKFPGQDEKVKGSRQHGPQDSRYDAQFGNSPKQISVATAVLPSYKAENSLKSVETLVSTKSGEPRITCISLRYDDDPNRNFSDKDSNRVSTRPLSHAHEGLSFKEREQKSEIFYNEKAFSTSTPVFSNAQTTEHENIYQNMSSYRPKSEQLTYDNSSYPQPINKRIEPMESSRLILNNNLHSKKMDKSLSSQKKEISPLDCLKKDILPPYFQPKEAAPLYSYKREKSPPHSQPKEMASFHPQLREKSISNFQQKELHHQQRDKSPLRSQYTSPLSFQPKEKLSLHSQQKDHCSHQTKRESLYYEEEANNDKLDEEIQKFSIEFSNKTDLKHKSNSNDIYKYYRVNEGQALAGTNNEVDRLHEDNYHASAYNEISSDIHNNKIDTEQITGPTKHALEPRVKEKENRMSGIFRDVKLTEPKISPAKSSKSIRTRVEESRNSDKVNVEHLPRHARKPSDPLLDVKEKQRIVYEKASNKKSTFTTKEPSSAIKKDMSNRTGKVNERNYSHRIRGESKSREKEETDEEMLSELTRAADQILHAVNGYTDEESNKASASSDDCEDRLEIRSKRRLHTPQVKKSNLNTIHESSHAKKTEKRYSETKIVKSSSRNRIFHKPSSSTSSVESFTMDNHKLLTQDKPVARREYRRKTGSDRSRNSSDSSSKIKLETPSRHRTSNFSDSAKNNILSEVKNSSRKPITNRHYRRHTSSADSDKVEITEDKRKSSKQSAETIYGLNNSSRIRKESSERRRSRMKERSGESQLKSSSKDTATTGLTESYNRTGARSTTTITTDEGRLKRCTRTSDSAQLISKSNKVPTRPRIVNSGAAVITEKSRRRKVMSQDTIVTKDKSATKTEQQTNTAK